MNFLKFNRIAMLAFVAVGMAFTACSDDDNDGENDGPSNPAGTGDYGQFTEPTMAKEAARFSISDPNSPFSSIELTESGRYLVLPAQYNSYFAARKKFPATASILLKESRSENVSTGKYTKIGENEYLLEGFGTITITGSSTEACELIITKEDGTEITVGAQPDQVFATDPITLALCRSWQTKELRMRMSIDGSVVTDRRGSVNNLSTLAYNIQHDMYNWAKKHGMVEEDETIDDFEVDMPVIADEVIFTKVGSYLLLKDSQIAYSIWAWKNQNNGLLHYSHNVNSFYDPTYSNDASVSFDGKTMTMYEFSADQEDGMTFKYETWSYCSELY